MKRHWAASLVFAIALLVLTGVGFLVVPPLVTQVSDFVNAVPDFIDDLTAGRGPLGWLQDEYQIVDRVREAIEKQGPGGVLGLGAGRAGRRSERRHGRRRERSRSSSSPTSCFSRGRERCTGS